jgi:hypothetical protein
MKSLVKKLKSKVLTKLFIGWVNDEYDLSLLSATRTLIVQRETKLKQFIDSYNKVEVKGFIK